MSHYYALTLRKTRKPIKLSDYEQHIKELTEKRLEVLDVNYEDTKGLHLHCVIASPHELNYNNFKSRGWNYLFKPIFYHRGWIKYCTKDMSKEIYLRYQQEELELFAPPDWRPNQWSEESEQGSEAPRPVVGHETPDKRVPNPSPDSPNTSSDQSTDSHYRRCVKRIKRCKIV